MENRKAIIRCELAPASGPNGEDTSCKVHIEGSLNGLLNAYTQISIRILEAVKEAEDGDMDRTMGMYAHVQTEVLKEIGIDPEKETKKRVEELEKKLRVLDGLKDILGKTFTPDGKEVKDGEEE